MKISLSKFRTIVSNEWLANQKFPIELTRGAGNAKRVEYLLVKAPLHPPLKLKTLLKPKNYGGSTNGSERSV